MDPSSTFKNKRDKHSPIRLKKPISRDKSESINKLALTLKDDTTENKRQKNMKDKMPMLQQNQKSCIPTHKTDPMQYICFFTNERIS
jgi:hypothetical protein